MRLKAELCVQCPALLGRAVGWPLFLPTGSALGLVPWADGPSNLFAVANVTAQISQGLLGIMLDYLREVQLMATLAW